MQNEKLNFEVAAEGKREDGIRSLPTCRAKWFRITRIAFGIALLLCLISLIGMLALTYRADDEKIAEYTESHATSPSEISIGVTVFEVEGAVDGFIFYPGGLVESDAYIPLVSALAEKGVLTVLIEMPLNLAVLDINAADGIREMYPEIENWYIGGHSLGGAMAASYLAKNAEDFCGLVLLGAYSSEDLSDLDIEVISVYGSCDGVMNAEKYEKCKQNLPNSALEVIIMGGNHAYFGMYGEQSGDGAATITPEDQIYLTVERIYEMIEN